MSMAPTGKSKRDADSAAQRLLDSIARVVKMRCEYELRGNQHLPLKNFRMMSVNPDNFWLCNTQWLYALLELLT